MRFSDWNPRRPGSQPTRSWESPKAQHKNRLVRVKQKKLKMISRCKGLRQKLPSPIKLYRSTGVEDCGRPAAPAKRYKTGEDKTVMQNVVLKLHPDDNVLIALRDLRKGEQIEYFAILSVLSSDIPAKHKFATEELAPGCCVYSCMASSWEKPRRPIPERLGAEHPQYSSRCFALPRKADRVRLDSARCLPVAEPNFSGLPQG